ncbi:B3 domain-containing protein Os11g0197600-like [Lolium rigidum]|uniref:B3 domain-containing protein Os11g0197600-like n=1 Tax=Lolium rigidum TaxID=89674 RepID=UPI001F5D3FA6|nr:B3 domain-containing protein Os11g0197600-like [Lolium rigidum]
MAVRNNGKGNWDASRKEGSCKNFGQKFCKLFFAAESRKRLRIPPSFNQYLLENPTGLVCLRGPSGNTWLAELSSDTEGLFFGDGWNKFVMDHSIESGHILTFCYDGRSQFSVVVFDGMCIEKPSGFHAKPSKDLVGPIESDERDKQMSPVPQEENHGTRKKTREIDANGSTLRKHCNGALVGDNSVSLNNTEDSVSSYHVSEENISRNESSKSTPGSLKLSKDVDICGKKKNISRNKSKSVPMLLNFSKDVYIDGKTIAEVQRQPEVISQRPPVCEEQQNNALQKAKQYKSKYPITMQIMKETYVYKTFFMNIPCEFVREYLPRTDKKLTLSDPQGMAWEVDYVYCSQRCSGAFSRGWGKFSVGNHLETFDVCVFELLSEDNINVRIYRANAALYPYLSY